MIKFKMGIWPCAMNVFHWIISKHIKYKFAVLIAMNKHASRDCVCKTFIVICTYVLIQEIEKRKTVEYLYLVINIYPYTQYNLSNSHNMAAIFILTSNNKFILLIA